MRATSFKRQLGPITDVKELEYISALHQSDRFLRKDGSITATDIVHFLSSRYGIIVTKEEVTKQILAGLGGGDNEEECIDITEVVAILLIPFLLKILQCAGTTTSNDMNLYALSRQSMSYDQNKKKLVMPTDTPNIIAEVATMVLSDATKMKNNTTTNNNATTTTNNNNITSSHTNSFLQQQQEEAERSKMYIDQRLVKSIFMHYGEKELAEDDVLVNEMVLAATGGKENVVFNHESFLKALTFDIQNYDIENETTITSNYYDVFQTHYTTASEGLSQQSTTTSKISESIFGCDNNTGSSSGSGSGSGGGCFQSIINSICCCCCLNNNNSPTTTDKKSQNDSNPIVVDEEQVLSSPTSFGSSYDTTTTAPPSSHQQQQQLQDEKKLLRPVKKIYTAPQIDSSADTYMSKIFTVLLWSFFVMFSFAYVPNPTGTIDWRECETIHQIKAFDVTVYENTKASFSCKVINRIIDWFLIGVCFCFGGTFFIFIGSLGNSIYAHSKRAIFIALVAMIIATVPPFVMTMGGGVKTPPDDYYHGGGYQVTRHGRIPAFILGLLVVLALIFQLWGLYLSKEYLQQHKRLYTLFTYGNVISESRIKLASAYKVNCMVKNARNIHADALLNNNNNNNNATKTTTTTTTTTQETHQPITDSETATNINGVGNIGSGGTGEEDDTTTTKKKHHSQSHKNKSYYDQALFHYEQMHGELGDDSEEEVCGFRWTIHSILSKDLYLKEGVWISSRIVVGGLAQVIIAFIIPFLGLEATGHFVNFVDETAINVADKENTLAILKLSGQVGSLVAFVACLCLSIIPIPAAISTALQFRCGYIPSLQDEKFKRYRYAPDSVSKILGSMFWGVFYSGVGVFLFVALITFLVLYPETREFCTSLLASIIGFTITFLIRILVLLLSRRLFYAGLYRTNPARAIFTILALECWNIGLGAGFMLARIIKLMAVAVLYVGRVDTPILARGVGEIGPLKLDDTATSYRRDIVAHEAHRHPYLELLGVMYMMKLRHGTSFAHRAGSCWRLVFVFALMPWLRSYRILTKYSQQTEAAEMEEDQSAINTRLVLENARLKNEVEMLRQRPQFYPVTIY